jgi:antitoxin MazE
MKTTVRLWGHSLAIRIPKTFAVHLGIVSGEEVELSMESGNLRIAPLQENLSALLEKVRPENLHDETDTGTTLGLEVW